MIDERDENKSRKPRHVSDLDDDRQSKPTKKGKSVTNIREYSGPHGPEYWAKMNMKIDSPDFVRADFYFFKIVWSGADATYPGLSTDILEAISEGVAALDGIAKGDEYAVFYRLARRTPKDQMRLEILGILPFFPKTTAKAALLLSPLDEREQVLLVTLCQNFQSLGGSKRVVHARPFHVEATPPMEKDWPKCWPGDARFSSRHNTKHFGGQRGALWAQ